MQFITMSIKYNSLGDLIAGGYKSKIYDSTSKEWLKHCLRQKKEKIIQIYLYQF